MGPILRFVGCYREISSVGRSSELMLWAKNDQKLFGPCNKPQNNYKIIMKEVRFEWDRKKDLANIRSHGVAFDEAKTVFYDENAIEFYDEAHSERQQRLNKRSNLKN